MKKLLPLFCLLYLISSCRTKNTETNSLLWRISKQGSKDSYLFGTMHILCQKDYLWTTAMSEALEESDKVCFELDMDDPNIMLEATEGMAKPAARKLKDYFTEEQYLRIQSFALDSLGIDLSVMQDMKPVYVQTLFMTKLIDCPFPVSYEANIMADAKKQKKDIMGLETTKEQLDVLNNESDDSMALSLLEMTDSFGIEKAKYQQMLQAFHNQNVNDLFRQASQSKEIGSDMTVFLDDRNKRWISKMEHAMKDQSVFFAVGAGHLGGSNGLINLLKRSGYTLEAIR